MQGALEANISASIFCTVKVCNWCDLYTGHMVGRGEVMEIKGHKRNQAADVRFPSSNHNGIHSKGSEGIRNVVNVVKR